MVFVRYVLNQNTIWQTDFVTYSLVAATFIGSPYVLMTRGHVNVDVLPLYLGRARAGGWRCSRRCWPLAFCVTMAVLTFAVLAGGLEPALAVRHHVARAAVDSLCVDADRPRRSSRCSTWPTCYGLVTGREPPFGIASGARAHEPARRKARSSSSSR